MRLARGRGTPAGPAVAAWLPALLLAGCVVPPATLTLSEREVAAAVRFETDAATAETWAIGPVLEREAGLPPGHALSYQLRSRAAADPARAQHVLRVRVRHDEPEPRDYFRAATTDGPMGPVRTVQVDSQCRDGRCVHVEVVDVPVDSARMRLAARQGLLLWLQKRQGGDTGHVLPFGYVAGQLQALERQVP